MIGLYLRHVERGRCFGCLRLMGICIAVNWEPISAVLVWTMNLLINCDCGCIGVL